MTAESGTSAPRSRIVIRSGLVLLVLGAAFTFAWREYGAFRGPLRAAARDYLAHRRVEKHADVLRAASKESGVDPYLLGALMIVESSGRVGARSSQDAFGLFQLKLVSAQWRAQELGLPPPSEEDLLTDPLLNARLGADNLAWLLETYDGDVVRALCAYNAGARRLKEIVDAEGGWEKWNARHERAGDSRILAYAHRVLSYRDELVERGTFGPIFLPEPGPSRVRSPSTGGSSSRDESVQAAEQEG